MADINHSEAIELISDDYNADSDNMEDALKDQKFRSGDQWTETERRERETAGRPCLTINETNKFVDQVAGELRKAQVGIQVLPVDSREDKAIAEIYAGLIRQIEYQSHGTTIYGHGVESAVGCSIGHWRVATQLTKDSPFLQEIKLQRVLDPLSVIWDAQSTGIVREDATRCWVTQWIHKSAWERRFPRAKRNLEDVPIDGDPGGSSSGLYWRRGEFVRIAEYWYEVPEDRTFVMLDTGQTLDITDVDPFEVQRLRFDSRIVNEATQQAPKIFRRMMDGSDWLGDEEDWAGQYIPIVPVMGREIAFDGKVLRRSLIRDAKDPQKLQNYWRSAAAEMVGKQPKMPWQATQKQVGGLEDYYAAANRTDVPILPYNVDPDAPTAMPTRVDPPQLPQAMLQQAALARNDMQETTGVPILTVNSSFQNISGRSAIAQQREGDVPTFIYSENFGVAMWRTGQILIDLIPRIYDTERQIRILQPDETEQYVPINVRVSSVDGEEILINDLSNRRFDVRVKVGASYTTARAETQEQIFNALNSNPALWGIVGDLLFRNSEFPGAEEIADRLERTIPDVVKSDDANQPQQPDPLQQAIAQLNLALLQARVAGAEASAQKDMATAQKTIAQVPQVVADTQQTVIETEGQEIENEADMQALESGLVQPV